MLVLPNIEPTHCACICNLNFKIEKRDIYAVKIYESRKIACARLSYRPINN